MTPFVHAEIDAPNLIFFEYRGEVKLGSFLVANIVPSCCKAHLYQNYRVDSRYFISLREFLMSSIQFKFLSLQIFTFAKVQDSMSIYFFTFFIYFFLVFN
jgi:hypothetical protein